MGNVTRRVDSAVRLVADLRAETVFHFRSRGQGWCEIFVHATKEANQGALSATGFFTALCDLGAFGDHWSSIPVPEGMTPPMAVLRFFADAQRDADYFARRLSKGEREFDPEGTIASIRENIIYHRRHRSMSASEARMDWTRSERIHDLVGFIDWCEDSCIREHLFVDPREYGRMRTPRRFRDFVDTYLAGRFAPAAEVYLRHEARHG